jgi:hypothetical protein
MDDLPRSLVAVDPSQLVVDLVAIALQEPPAIPVKEL